MITLDPCGAASRAVPPSTVRPAVATIHDAPDVRLVVFRIEAGQEVTPHVRRSTVLLHVLEGAGIISGQQDESTVDRACKAGESFAFVPGELHGMRAEAEALTLLATITPRPGAR